METEMTPTLVDPVEPSLYEIIQVGDPREDLFEVNHYFSTASGGEWGTVITDDPVSFELALRTIRHHRMHVLNAQIKDSNSTPQPSTLTNEETE